MVGGGPWPSAGWRRCSRRGARGDRGQPDAHRRAGGAGRGGRIRHVARDYGPGDLAGATLAFTATDDRAVSRAVARQGARARRLGQRGRRSRALRLHPAPVLRRGGLLTVAVAIERRQPGADARHPRGAGGAYFGRRLRRRSVELAARGAARAAARAGRAAERRGWRRALAADVRRARSPRAARGRGARPAPAGAAWPAAGVSRQRRPRRRRPGRPRPDDGARPRRCCAAPTSSSTIASSNPRAPRRGARRTRCAIFAGKRQRRATSCRRSGSTRCWWPTPGGAAGRAAQGRRSVRVRPRRRGGRGAGRRRDPLRGRAGRQRGGRGARRTRASRSPIAASPSSFAVVTGHEDAARTEASVDWARLATAVDTLVVLMGAAQPAAHHAGAARRTGRRAEHAGRAHPLGHDRRAGDAWSARSMRSPRWRPRSGWRRRSSRSSATWSRCAQRLAWFAGEAGDDGAGARAEPLDPQLREALLRRR